MFNKIEIWWKEARWGDEFIGVVELNDERILLREDETIIEIQKKVNEFREFATIGEVL